MHDRELLARLLILSLHHNSNYSNSTDNCLAYSRFHIDGALSEEGTPAKLQTYTVCFFN